MHFRETVKLLAERGSFSFTLEFAHKDVRVQEALDPKAEFNYEWLVSSKGKVRMILQDQDGSFEASFKVFLVAV